MEAIYQQAKALLEYGDTPVEVFEKLSQAHEQVTQDDVARATFRKELRGIIALLWHECRKLSVKNRAGRRI